MSTVTLNKDSLQLEISEKTVSHVSGVLAYWKPGHGEDLLPTVELSCAISLINIEFDGGPMPLVFKNIMSPSINMWFHVTSQGSTCWHLKAFPQTFATLQSCKFSSFNHNNTITMVETLPMFYKLSKLRNQWTHLDLVVAVNIESIEATIATSIPVLTLRKNVKMLKERSTASNLGYKLRLILMLGAKSSMLLLYLFYACTEANFNQWSTSEVYVILNKFSAIVISDCAEPVAEYSRETIEAIWDLEDEVEMQDQTIEVTDGQYDQRVVRAPV
ncbi:hypothetical protein DFP72DRAFT_844373 [Ephemerocybe angulata]|uniref:Uncharacterized protein n=1 Tax=Ephemerocybe angulata TaxID=980116 RepID=A0A8H6I722_9AGAR|nr:hypothetical protein DFP72DRAFT_844373 [Tulosesus angulatus]